MLCRTLSFPNLGIINVLLCPFPVQSFLARQMGDYREIFLHSSPPGHAMNRFCLVRIFARFYYPVKSSRIFVRAPTVTCVPASNWRKTCKKRLTI